MDDAAVVNELLRHAGPLRGRVRRALDHAVQAIEDRAAMLALYDEDGGGTEEHAERRLRLHFAVERHMRGEP